VLDGRLARPLTEVKVKCDPARPTVDPLSGTVEFKLTLGASSAISSVALRFAIKSAAPELNLNMATPQFALVPQSAAKAAAAKAAAEASAAGSATGARCTPKADSADRSRTVYSVGRFDVLCCEKLQLLDETVSGFGHVVWDSGVVLAHHVASEYVPPPHTV